MKTLLNIFLAIILLMSCGKKIDCIDSNIVPVFINYTDADIDTFIIRRYVPNTSFQNLVDSFLLVTSYEGFAKVGNDTTYVSFRTGDATIRPGFDFQLFLPATNQTTSISNILTEKTTGREKREPFGQREGCINPFISYTVNNQILNVPRAERASAAVFIYK